MAEENKNPETETKETCENCTHSERDTIISEMHELNIQYKQLIQQKQQVGSQLQKLDEKILKKIGAFQALKKLLAKIDGDKVPEDTPPSEEKKDETPEKSEETEPEKDSKAEDDGTTGSDPEFGKKTEEELKREPEDPPEGEQKEEKSE